MTSALGVFILCATLAYAQETVKASDTGTYPSFSYDASPGFGGVNDLPPLPPLDSSPALSPFFMQSPVQSQDAASSLTTTTLEPWTTTIDPSAISTRPWFMRTTETATEMATTTNTPAMAVTTEDPRMVTTRPWFWSTTEKAVESTTLKKISTTKKPTTKRKLIRPTRHTKSSRSPSTKKKSKNDKKRRVTKKNDKKRRVTKKPKRESKKDRRGKGKLENRRKKNKRKNSSKTSRKSKKLLNRRRRKRPERRLRPWNRRNRRFEIDDDDDDDDDYKYKRRYRRKNRRIKDDDDDDDDDDDRYIQHGRGARGLRRVRPRLSDRGFSLDSRRTRRRHRPYRGRRQLKSRRYRLRNRRREDDDDDDEDEEKSRIRRRRWNRRRLQRRRDRRYRPRRRSFDYDDDDDDENDRREQRISRFRRSRRWRLGRYTTVLDVMAHSTNEKSNPALSVDDSVNFAGRNKDNLVSRVLRALLQRRLSQQRLRRSGGFTSGFTQIHPRPYNPRFDNDDDDDDDDDKKAVVSPIYPGRNYPQYRPWNRKVSPPSWRDDDDDDDNDYDDDRRNRVRTFPGFAQRYYGGDQPVPLVRRYIRVNGLRVIRPKYCAPSCGAASNAPLEEELQ
ncbi:hypothetical protein Y032_0014g2388 [Ancylostoma ceylanicum]|uniref:Uncharacterized protein n=1 Tax=Ancylostoma ceylanicum TaxID=53326 RepID=A0A016V980_9BILA|nr:hypothetical protein Y032_0014g2388 [Ancylostoma ceylanicum]